MHRTPAHPVAAEPAIVVDGLLKRYRDRTVVDGVSFTVDAGETFGLVGPNGAGKTTTVEVVAGLRRLTRDDRGTVRVLGLDPRRDRRPLRRVLGVQPQSPALHGALTVEELLRLHRGVHATPRSVSELLAIADLQEQRRTRFDRLSGGQQQRLSVAVALAGRPRAVILDELTNGLDPGARRRMWRVVEALRDEGCAVLLVSHAMEEVERLCDRVAVLDRGQLLVAGAPAEVVASADADSLDEAFLRLTGTRAEAAG